MNNIYNFLKRYLVVITILITVSIVLSMSYSNFMVTSENHKVAEMYIGTLKYSMTIDGSTTNTLSVPSGETIVDVTITNENPIDTYYKLIYENNSNVTIKYYQAYELDSSNNPKAYSKPNDKITLNSTNSIKLKITNSSTSSQNITFKIVGGFATNTLDDITVPSGYTTIEKDTSTNTYFCTTTDTLTQGLQYVNGQYTYAYMQEGSYVSSGWSNISNNGWGVQLTNKTSTDAVTSKVCTYINNKPITSMSYMFYNSKATTLNLSSLNTENVTNMKEMLSGSQATTLDVSNFDTSNVTTMYGMFWSSQAATLDLSSFNTSNVTDMSNMFSESQATTLALSSFNTSKVVNMTKMFYNSQVTTLDLSNFDTSSVTDMSYTFQGSQATTIDVSNFDTSNVTSMGQMFFGIQTPVLDLSSFDTSNVKTMYGMFWTSPVKTIYVSDKFTVDNLTSFGRTRMFSKCKNLVGGVGTAYSDYEEDGARFAHIDGGTSNPGYFTDISDKPKEPESFATDSWPTIANAVKNGNTGKYNVGDTKTIDMGTYGTHTLRIANTTTPSECSTTGFSQSACGFVLEFTDIITTHTMNDNTSNTIQGDASNVGGWPASDMYTFVNTDIYNALPNSLRSVIIDTVTVSGHGGRGGTENFTSTDKLYLLAPKEIYTDFSSSWDSAKDLMRTLDYYTSKGVTIKNYSEAIKKNGTTAGIWWTRSADSISVTNFYVINNNGFYSNGYGASNTYGVSPAFRIG